MPTTETRPRAGRPRVPGGRARRHAAHPALVCERARLGRGARDHADRAGGRRATERPGAHRGPVRPRRPGRRAPRDPSGARPSMPLAALFSPRGIAVVGASRDPRKLGAALPGRWQASPARWRASTRRPGSRRRRCTAPSPRRPRTRARRPGAGLRPAAAAPPLALTEAAAAGARGRRGLRRAASPRRGGAGGGTSGTWPRSSAAGRHPACSGPNTSGFLPAGGCTPSFVPGAAERPAGPVAVVAASGGVNHALAFLLAEAGHGVSARGRPGQRGRRLHAGRPRLPGRRLAAPAPWPCTSSRSPTAAHGRRRPVLTARKPVVALVVGRHDVGDFAASHTGALATSWRTTRAALAQAGAVLVDDERELVDAVGALVGSPAARRHRVSTVGVVTAQAGPGLLLLDELAGPWQPPSRS